MNRVQAVADLLAALRERREARNGLIEDSMGNYHPWASKRYEEAERAVRDAVRELEDTIPE